MIDLNDEKFDAKKVSIFNDGNAGIVENVTISIEKKGKEDKENAPDYKIICTDANGSSCNTGIYYPSATEYKDLDKAIADMAKGLKHLITTFGLTPGSYPNANAMLDGVMIELKNAVKGVPVRIIATYGSTMGPKEYIQPRSLNWVPWIELMSVPKEDSKLVISTSDNLTRKTPDAVSNGTPATANAGSDW